VDSGRWGGVNKTKIDWCDMSWNPVSGCYHSCKYCYAKKIAKRFGAKYVGEYENNNFILSDKAAKYIINPETKEGNILMAQHEPIFKNIGILDEQDRRYTAFPFGFCPTLHTQRLDEPQKVKKSQRIFVVSMGDLFGDWVPDSWIEEVFKACEAAPWHKYLFLTKNPKRYLSLYNKKIFPYKENFWFGTTITGPDDEFVWVENTPYKTFISIEPLLKPLGKLESGHMPDWVIIGEQTGPGAIPPKPEWVESIIEQCRAAGMPVFVKNPLYKLFPVQEWPEGLEAKSTK
jgi:protein gp37